MHPERSAKAGASSPTLVAPAIRPFAPVSDKITLSAGLKGGGGKMNPGWGLINHPGLLPSPHATASANRAAYMAQ